jgi:beta-N-acetylhexosaminidase
LALTLLSKRKIPTANPLTMTKKSTHKLVTITLLLLVGWLFTAASRRNEENNNNDYIQQQYAWADSLLARMTLQQKIGQLFMIATYSNRTEADYRIIENQIRQYHVGGLVFFQGNPQQQALLTNRYQTASQTPLLIGIDAEWGLGMRLDNAMSFPRQITLGAIQDNYLIEQMGEEIGKQCKRLGIHINFAPVTDINTNPENPVINYRSFGESKYNVAEKAVAYARGLRRAGIMASAKHFPGHGDTDTDSHFSMPVISKSEKQLWETELFPFQQLIADSISSVMTGHLNIPSLDIRTNRSGTVSDKIVTDLLKNRMGFQGLAITDALNMRGLTTYYTNGNAELEAYKAGNDILLQTANLPVAFQKLKSAFENGNLAIEELDRRVHKILRAKYWAGLHTQKMIDINFINEDINNEYAQSIKYQLFENAVTVVKNYDALLPFIHLDTTSFASILVSPNGNSIFQQSLSQYANFKHFKLPFKPSKDSDWMWTADQAAKHSVVVVAVHDMNALRSKNYGVSYATANLINYLSKKTKVVVCAFGNPYGLRLFSEANQLLCGYEDEPEAHRAVAQILFGALPAKGKLPVTVSRDMRLEQGVFTPQLGRLGYATPESVGLDATRLADIGRIANEGISQGAYPGCQVLVARRGRVVYHKSFGNLRYGTNEPVTNATLYDLASLTKVTATLQAIMLLNERGEIDLSQRIANYLPELEGTNKADLLLGELLMHQAGLKSFVPFWTNTKSVGGAFMSEYYQFSPSEENLQVADNLYITPAIRDSVWQWIIKTPLTPASRDGGHRYLYSDLGLLMLQKVVEKVTNWTLDEFLEQSIYDGLGMSSTLFNPLRKFPKTQIAPTEFDQTFRGTALQGTVHDPNAALLGGVAGHAGLFSTTWDLAKLFQMNLQQGFYGGRSEFFPETVAHFSRSYSSKSHRGLGWNKPTGDEQTNVATTASLNSYGHTGFTGTVAWIDPDQQLVFIMLANRVYPNANNKRLMQLEIRRKMHEAVYRSFIYN